MKMPLSRMYSRLVVLLIALSITAVLQAQENFPVTTFGLVVGANANSWTNHFPETYVNGQVVYPDSWKTTYGAHVGIYANLRLSRIVALEPALMYSMKGTGTIRSEGGFDIEGNIRSAYLDAPFLLRIYLSEGFNLVLGPQLSYHLSSKYDLIVANEKVIDGNDTTQDISEYDMSAILGLGYQFPSGVNISLRGEMGFWTVDTYQYLSTYNRNIRLSVGIPF